MSATLPDGFLRDLRQRLEAHYGPRLVRAVLFGSHARGEATEDSDVDVLVVLEGEVDMWEEAKALGGISLDLMLDHDQFVTFVARDREGAQSAWSFMRNVRRDGKPIVA